MPNKKFKLTESEAKSLIWTTVLNADEMNFTPEFRRNVINIIKKIRELEV